MPYSPHFTITPSLLALVEQVAGLREKIAGAVVDLAWIPGLQKDSAARNAHASTAIEGNPLIHPFADGNGRTGWELALWELYRRGFDTRFAAGSDEPSQTAACGGPGGKGRGKKTGRYRLKNP